MPLLTDRYKNKSQTRSSVIEDKIKKEGNRPIAGDHVQTTQIDHLDNLQKIKATHIDIVKRTYNTIKGVKLITPNVVIRAFSLDKKEGLEGVLFSHYDVATELDVTLSLVWSQGDPSELTIPVTNGVIETTEVIGGSVFRIITITIPNSSSFMLPKELISHFEFINKKINFYVTSSLTGVEMTIFTK